MSLRPELGRGAIRVGTHDEINNVRMKAGKSVCKIDTFHNFQGTGALYHVVDKRGRDRYLLMTCNHVMPTNSILDVLQTRFLFEDIQKMANGNSGKYSREVCLDLSAIGRYCNRNFS